MDVDVTSTNNIAIGGYSYDQGVTNQMLQVPSPIMLLVDISGQKLWGQQITQTGYSQIEVVKFYKFNSINFVIGLLIKDDRTNFQIVLVKQSDGSIYRVLENGSNTLTSINMYPDSIDVSFSDGFLYVAFQESSNWNLLKIRPYDQTTSEFQKKLPNGLPFTLEYIPYSNYLAILGYFNYGGVRHATIVHIYATSGDFIFLVGKASTELIFTKVNTQYDQNSDKGNTTFCGKFIADNQIYAGFITFQATTSLFQYLWQVLIFNLLMLFKNNDNYSHFRALPTKYGECLTVYKTGEWIYFLNINLPTAEFSLNVLDIANSQDNPTLSSKSLSQYLDGPSNVFNDAYIIQGQVLFVGDVNRFRNENLFFTTKTGYLSFQECILPLQGDVRILDINPGSPNLLSTDLTILSDYENQVSPSISQPSFQSVTIPLQNTLITNLVTYPGYTGPYTISDSFAGMIIVYYLGDPKQTYAIPSFQISDAQCSDVVFNYTAHLKDGTNMTPFIRFYANNLTVEIETSDPSLIRNYQLVVEGTLNNGLYHKGQIALQISSYCDQCSFTLDKPEILNSECFKDVEAWIYLYLPKGLTGSCSNCTETSFNLLMSGVEVDQNFINYNSYALDNRKYTLKVTSMTRAQIYNLEYKINFRDGYSQTWPFILTILKNCGIAVPLYYSNISDITYYLHINKTLEITQLNWTTNDIDCNFTDYKLFKVDNLNIEITYPIFSSSNGSLTMNVDSTTEASYANNARFVLRGYIQDSDSTWDSNVFGVTFIDNCVTSADQSLTGDSQLYYIGGTELVIPIIDFFQEPGCDNSLRYTGTQDSLYTVQIGTSYVSNFIKIDAANRMIKVFTNSVFDVGNYPIQITGHLDPHSSLSLVYNFNLQIKDPCSDVTFINTPQNQQEQLTYYYGSMILLPFDMNSTYESSCGKLQFTLTSVSSNPLLSQVATNYNATHMKIYFTGSKQVTAYTFKVEAKYANYPEKIQYYYVLMNIINCANNLLVFDNPSLENQTVTYSAQSGGQVFELKTTQSMPSCSASVSYTKTLTDVNCTLAFIQTIVSIQGPNYLKIDQTQIQGKYCQFTVTVTVQNGASTATKDYGIFLSGCGEITPSLNISYNLNPQIDISLLKLMVSIDGMFTAISQECWSFIQYSVTPSGGNWGKFLKNSNNIQLTNPTQSDKDTYTFSVSGCINTYCDSQTLTIIVMNSCDSNIILANKIADLNYEIGSPQTQTLGSFQFSQPQCPLTYSLSVDGMVTYPGFIKFDDTKNQLNLSSTNVSDAKTYNVCLFGKDKFNKLNSSCFNLKFFVGCRRNYFIDFSMAQMVVQIGGGSTSFKIKWKDYTNGLCDSHIKYELNYTSILSLDQTFALFNTSTNNLTIETNLTSLNSQIKEVEVIGFINSKKQSNQTLFVRFYQFSCTPTGLIAFGYYTIPSQNSNEIEYVIGSGELTIYFTNFTVIPNTCDLPISYSLQDNGKPSAPTYASLYTSAVPNYIKIYTHDKNEGYQPRRTLILIGQISGQGFNVIRRIRIPLKLKAKNIAGPSFKEPLDNQIAIVNQKFKLNFPELMDQDGDEIAQIKVDFGDALSFVSGTFPNYTIAPTNKDYGTYTIIVEVTDDNPNPLKMKYDFQLFVLDLYNKADQQTNSTLEARITNKSEIAPDLKAKINSVSVSGKVRVNFNKRMMIPPKYAEFDQSVLLIEIYDANQVKVEIKFDWRILDFTTYQMIIQLQFEDPDQLSRYVNLIFNDLRIKITQG